jgi:S1-C subfamily serine protease
MCLTSFEKCRTLWRAAGILLLAIAADGRADALIETIPAVRASVVGVGTFQKTRSPAAAFFGTGFAVGDGLHIITNAHVIPPMLDEHQKESLVVLVGRGAEFQQRDAQVLGTDLEHDLVLLHISGPPLPALRLGDSDRVREGQSLALTGYPLGMALGLIPATHRATLAAITPIAKPTLNSRLLNPKIVSRIRDGAFAVFQLDGTAYPGNSGSPLYDPDTGEVLGIINMVFVKGTRENAITNPSGISYAIPSKFIREFLAKAGVRP